MAIFNVIASQPNSDGTTRETTYKVEAYCAYDAWWNTICEFEGTLVSIHGVEGYTKRKIGQASTTFYKTGSEEPPLSNDEKMYANYGYTAGYTIN